MQLLPMGDQALLAYCEDEQAALGLAARIRGRRLPWVLDVVQAYTSVAFFLDLDRIGFPEASESLAEAAALVSPDEPTGLGKLHIIPCCYDLGLDLARVAEATKLSAEDVIRTHAQQIYTVYAIGFCPGFPYLGYLPKVLHGLPRLPSPRQHVEAGSVGLTGRQTGIYTMDRPGGWNIIGRTPLVLVDVADGYFPLRTGDRVQFRSIDRKEYEALQGDRLV